MALEKITEAQMNATGVCAAPDILNGTPAENKAVFDRMVRNLVAPAYNACVDAVNELQDVETGVVAAEAERAEAEKARKEAETAREDKETGYVAQAEKHARAASASANDANSYAKNAQNAEHNAQSWAAQAENSAINAIDAKRFAEGHADAAKDSATRAEVAVMDATNAKSNAQASADRAEAAAEEVLAQTSFVYTGPDEPGYDYDVWIDTHGEESPVVQYVPQNLTNAQKAQARENIGATSVDEISTDAVLYTPQTLTDEQKAQATNGLHIGDRAGGDRRHDADPDHAHQDRPVDMAGPQAGPRHQRGSDRTGGQAGKDRGQHPGHGRRTGSQKHPHPHPAVW